MPIETTSPYIEARPIKLS
jgi:hypothetical protein